jgi:hypothetical protein
LFLIFQIRFFNPKNKIFSFPVLVHSKLSTQANLGKIAKNGQKKSGNNYSGYEQDARTSREKRKLTGAKLYNVSYR